jgi:hypothetical protein
MAEQSEARNVFGCSNTGIVGLNPTQGVNVLPRCSMSCCPVQVEALRRADTTVQKVLSTVQQIHKLQKINSEPE